MLRRFGAALALLTLVAAACGDGGGTAGSTATPGTGGETITIYSGRSEELVGPIIEQFEQETNVSVEVRYGDTAELAAAILEEGDNTPADVFWAQDAGALGAVAEADAFAELPTDLLEQVPEGFRSPDGLWVGTSGRARVAVYNTGELQAEDMPASVLDLTDARWRGRVGWAPTNGSFQAFVTALRLVEGEEAARAWLEGMKANDVQAYPSNTPIVQAVAAGEIDVGLVNHYYLLELSETDEQVAQNAANHFFPGGDAGSLINVAGVGILEASDAQAGARGFVDYLLSRSGEQYFSEETFEYPLTENVEPDPRLPELSSLEQPDIDLSDLDDLQGTLELLQETGVL